MLVNRGLIELHLGRVHLLVPVDSWPDQTGCVLHLPGTGDQGFGRRMSLGLSLLKHVSLIVVFH